MRVLNHSRAGSPSVNALKSTAGTRAPAIIENPRHPARRGGDLFQLKERRHFQNAPRFQRVTVFAQLKK